MRRRPQIALLALVPVAALAIAGCGGDGDSDAGPAAIAPEDAPIYLEGTVRPEGAAAEDAKAALGKILDNPDPGAQLISLIETEAAQDGQPFDYEADVEPWLGERVGAFFSSFEGEGEGAAVVETSDPDAALEFVRKDEGVSGTEGETEYEGASYQLDSDGDAFGIVDDFLVVGDEAGFKAAVDAANGSSLGDSDEFKDSIEGVADDSLGLVYALPKNLLGAIPPDELEPNAKSIIEKSAGDALDEPVIGDLSASADDFVLEVSAGSTGVDTPESSLLETLPGDAWLGFGFGNLGDAVTRGLEQVEEAGIPGADIETIRSQVEAGTGLTLEEIADALGNGALYVTGTTEPTLSGALVIQTENPETTSELLTKLQSLLSASDPRELRVQPLASATGEVGFELIDPGKELPQPVQFVQSGDKVVIGYGANSATAALQGGGQTLAANPAFTAAQGKLSELGMDLFLSFAPVFQLAESQGAAADPEYQQAKPYIDGLDYLAVGSGSDDDRAQVRIIVGVK